MQNPSLAVQHAAISTVFSPTLPKTLGSWPYAQLSWARKGIEPALPVLTERCSILPGGSEPTRGTHLT